MDQVLSMRVTDDEKQLDDIPQSLKCFADGDIVVIGYERSA